MMLNNGFFSVYIYTICTCSSGFVWCKCPLSYISPLYIYIYIRTYQIPCHKWKHNKNKNTKKKACCFQNNVSFKLKMSHCPLAFRHCPVFTPLTCRTIPLKWLRTRDHKSHHRAYSASKRKQTIFTSLSSFSQLRNRSKLGYPPHLWLGFMAIDNDRISSCTYGYTKRTPPFLRFLGWCSNMQLQIDHHKSQLDQSS